MSSNDGGKPGLPRQQHNEEKTLPFRPKPLSDLRRIFLSLEAEQNEFLDFLNSDENKAKTDEADISLNTSFIEDEIFDQKTIADISLNTSSIEDKIFDQKTMVLEKTKNISQEITKPKLNAVLENSFVQDSVESKINNTFNNIALSSCTSGSESLSTPLNSRLDHKYQTFPIKFTEFVVPASKATIRGGKDGDKEFKTIIIKENRYTILNTIGIGGSSVVLHGFDKVNNCHRAIKRVNLNGECREGFINEVKLLRSLQSCDKVITMYDYEILTKKNVMHVVLERGESDLQSILKSLSKTKDHLPLYILFFYWMEMLLAVKQIHEKGIIHSDLKPANFLLIGGGLKLIDFGIASSMQNDHTSVIKDAAFGTFNYISPEALNCPSSTGGKEYKISFKSDVWSLGCILYQLVYKKTPFQHITSAAAKYSMIIDRDHVINFPEADWLPEKLLKQLKSCLVYDKRLRPSSSDLIEDCKTMFFSK